MTGGTEVCLNDSLLTFLKGFVLCESDLAVLKGFILYEFFFVTVLMNWQPVEALQRGFEHEQLCWQPIP